MERRLLPQLADAAHRYHVQSCERMFLIGSVSEVLSLRWLAKRVYAYQMVSK
jgi:hypothetical protein